MTWDHFSLILTPRFDYVLVIILCKTIDHYNKYQLTIMSFPLWSWSDGSLHTSKRFAFIIIIMVFSLHRGQIGISLQPIRWMCLARQPWPVNGPKLATAVFSGSYYFCFFDNFFQFPSFSLSHSQYSFFTLYCSLDCFNNYF